MIKYNPLNNSFDLVNSLKIGSAISGGTDGYILFSDAGKLAEDSGLFWDNLNKRLGIGIIPTSALHTLGNVNFGTDSDFSWNDSNNSLHLGATNGSILTITHPVYDSVLRLKVLDNSWNYISFYNSTARTGFFGMDVTGNNFTFAPDSGNTQVQSSLYVKTNLSVGTASEDERVTIRGNCKLNNVGDKLMYSNGHIVGMQVSPNKGILYDAKGTTGGWYGSHLFYTNFNGVDTTLAFIIKDKNIGIGGILSPTAIIHISSGTASNPPLKFTSGTVLTTPEAGTLEYLSNVFYVRGGDGLNIGSSVNYAEIKNDGEINLHGTARVKKGEWIGVSGLKAPGTKPAIFKEYGISGVWEFSDGTDDTLVFNFKIKKDMDITVAPSLIIGWSTNTAVTTETCVWQLEYLFTAPGEDTTAAAQETLTVDSNAIAQADGLITAEIIGMDLPSGTDVCVHCRLKRLGADADDDLTDTAELHGVCFSYTSNKLGEAL